MYKVINADTSELIKDGFTEIQSAHAWTKNYKISNSKDKTPMIAVKCPPAERLKVERDIVEPCDISIARFYLLKSERAAENGVEFSLTFAEFKRLSRASKCKFTGLNLDASTFTIDRIDNKLGYVTGNVAACHKVFNQIKSIAENPMNDVTVNMVASGFKKVTGMLRR